MKKTPNVTAENWRSLADKAYEECDDRPLTTEEKIALVVKELVDRYENAPTGQYRSLQLDWLASRSVLGYRVFVTTARNHIDLISRVMGVRYGYIPAEYVASGSGSFGRYSNKRSRYDKPYLTRYDHG